MGHIHLTFDDGPDAHWTPRILELLAHAQMQATFFMIGQQARGLPALVRRVALEGHAVGNHTFSHRHPWLMSSRQARVEVADGARALSDILGEAPYLYRPPHGRQRACMIEEAAMHGQRLILWDLSAIDWGVLGRARGIERRLARARRGRIVLMHDGPRHGNRPDQLLRVLPAFLTWLRDQQLQSVALAAHPPSRPAIHST